MPMPEEAPKEFIDWLNQQMKSRNWSVRETAKKAGISHTPISHAINGERPSYKTCIALADAFKTPRETVVRLAGHLPTPASWTEELTEWNELYKKLSKEDRLEMLQIGKLKTEKSEKR